MEAAAPATARRAAALMHVAMPPAFARPPRAAVLVIEEYDKLDCSMRGFFRQLLESGQVANVTLNRRGAGMDGAPAPLARLPRGQGRGAPPGLASLLWRTCLPAAGLPLCWIQDCSSHPARILFADRRSCWNCVGVGSAGSRSDSRMRRACPVPVQGHRCAGVQPGLPGAT